jgi:hypothetical protein
MGHLSCGRLLTACPENSSRLYSRLQERQLNPQVRPGDHLTAHELSKQALEHSRNALGFADNRGQSLSTLNKAHGPRAWNILALDAYYVFQDGKHTRLQ